LDLISSKTYDKGLVQLHYAKKITNSKLKQD